MKKAVATFGRLNPLTNGHEKLAKAIERTAKTLKAKPFLFLSQSQDPKKNPLSFADKYQFASKAFGNIVSNQKVLNYIDMLKKLDDMGFTDVVIIVGSDRIPEIKRLADRYNGSEYNFNTIEIRSAGDRDPDAEDVSGISASKMRAAAAENDFETFAKGAPRGLSKADVEKMFTVTRKKMNIKEEREKSLKKEEKTMKSFNQFINLQEKRRGRARTKESTEEGENHSWKTDGHYKKDGTEWKGDQHDYNGQVMTGKKHTKDSENLYHFKDLGQKARQMVLDKLKMENKLMKSFNQFINLQEKRPGRPRTNANPEDGDEGAEHIIMQLRKVVSTRGTKKVEFADGSSGALDNNPTKAFALAKKAIDKYTDFAKPSEKEVFQAKLMKSKKDFMSAIGAK